MLPIIRDSEIFTLSRVTNMSNWVSHAVCILFRPFTFQINVILPFQVYETIQLYLFFGFRKDSMLKIKMLWSSGGKWLAQVHKTSIVSEMYLQFCTCYSCHFIHSWHVFTHVFIQLFIYTFIYTFILLVFIKHILCARSCPRWRITAVNLLLPQSLYFNVWDRK